MNKNLITIPEEFVTPSKVPDKLPPRTLPFVTVSLRGQLGVPGGVETGVANGVPGGVLGNPILRGIASSVAPPAVQPKEDKRMGPPRRVSLGVLQGNAMRKVQPVYPPIARAARVLGQVQIEVIIDVDGSVVQATVIDGHPLLRQAALDAAQQWKFRPTLLSGEPITVTGILSFNFTL